MPYSLKHSTFPWRWPLLAAMLLLALIFRNVRKAERIDSVATDGLPLSIQADPTLSPQPSPTLEQQPPLFPANRLRAFSAQAPVTIHVDPNLPREFTVDVKGGRVRWQIEGEGNVVFDVPDASVPIQAGAPLVPAFTQAFEIPMDESLEVVTEDLVWVDQSLPGTLGVQSGLGRMEPYKDPSIWETDAFWPPDVVRVEEVIAGKRKYARISVHPIQVNPKQNTLRRNVATVRVRPRSSEGDALALAALSVSDPVVEPVAAGDCVCSNIKRTDVLPPMNGLASDFAPRRAGAEVDACVRIVTRQTGIHKVTRKDLTDAGISSSLIIGNDLRLFGLDREMAIYVSKPGLFTADTDYFLFHAEMLETYHTQEFPVWLGFGPGGLRWSTRAAAPLAATPDQSWACLSVLRDSHSLFQPVLKEAYPLEDFPASAFDAFDGFGVSALSKINGNTFAYVFSSGQTDFIVPNSPQKVEMKLWSTGSGNHSVQLRKVLGGTLATWPFVGFKIHTLQAQFTNQVTTANLQLSLGEYGDNLMGNLLEYFRLDVQRYLRPVSGQLGFAGGPGPTNILLQGLASPATTVVLDVADPWRPVQITAGANVELGALDGLRFAHIGPVTCYHFAENASLVDVVPADIRFRQPRWLGDPARTADYLVIAPDGFEADLRTLLAYRDSKGLEVMIAPVQDVYDEFGYGVKGPEAIKQFIGYAFHHWKKSPKMVLLVGDGRYNPRDTEANYPDFIPVPMGQALFEWTAMDPWYGAVHGSDPVMDVAIGRWPIESAAQLQRLVARVQSFDSQVASANRSDASSWRRKVALVTDYRAPDDFSDYADEIDVQILSQTNLTVAKHYLAPGGGNAAAVKTGTVNSFNQGSLAVSYLGHGAAASWSSSTIMDTPTAQGLVNSPRHPLVTVFTCQNGAFHRHRTLGGVATPSLPETLLRHDADGASAMVAPSGLALSLVSQQAALGFYEALFLDKYIVGMNGSVPEFETRDTHDLADVLLNMHLSLFLRVGAVVQESMLYHLFGDPGLIVDPETEAQK